MAHKWLSLYAVRAKDKKERDDWFAALSAPNVILPPLPLSSISTHVLLMLYAAIFFAFNRGACACMAWYQCV
jgi:hypothetical protein